MSRTDQPVPPSPTGSSIEIGLHGEIDLTNAADIEDLVSAALETGSIKVVVDLRGVTFIDSSGLNALVHAQRQTAAAGASISLRAVPRRVSDLLVLTGLDSAFTIET